MLRYQDIIRPQAITVTNADILRVTLAPRETFSEILIRIQRNRGRKSILLGFSIVS